MSPLNNIRKSKLKHFVILNEVKNLILQDSKDCADGSLRWRSG